MPRPARRVRDPAAFGRRNRGRLCSLPCASFCLPLSESPCAMIDSGWSQAEVRRSDQAPPFSDKAYQRPRRASLAQSRGNDCPVSSRHRLPVARIELDRVLRNPHKMHSSAHCLLWKRTCFIPVVYRKVAIDAFRRNASSYRGIPMSVAGIFSSLIGSNQVNSASNGRSQMQQLGQDLLSGNLSAAQSDFATLQQAFAQSAPISSTSTSNPVTQAFQQLATDL